MPRISAILILFLLLLCSSIYGQNAGTYDDSMATSTDTILPDDEIYESINEEEKNERFIKLRSSSWERGGNEMRKVPDSIIKKMQAEDDFWYANANLKKKEKSDKEGSSFFSGELSQTIIWFIIIGGFAAFLIWYLAGSNVGLFRKKNVRLDGDEGEELNTDDIFAINYQQEIDRAAQAHNYRLAVRLLFLRVLKNLADRNIIQYKQDRTNLDYLMQLQSTNYYKDFFRITRNYEYSWYGHFDVNEEAYQIIRKEFDNFENRMR